MEPAFDDVLVRQSQDYVNRYHDSGNNSKSK